MPYQKRILHFRHCYDRCVFVPSCFSLVRNWKTTCAHKPTPNNQYWHFKQEENLNATLNLNLNRAIHTISQTTTQFQHKYICKILTIRWLNAEQFICSRLSVWVKPINPKWWEFLVAATPQSAVFGKTQPNRDDAEWRLKNLSQFYEGQTIFHSPLLTTKTSAMHFTRRSCAPTSAAVAFEIIQNRMKQNY